MSPNQNSHLTFSLWNELEYLQCRQGCALTICWCLQQRISLLISMCVIYCTSHIWSLTCLFSIARFWENASTTECVTWEGLYYNTTNSFPLYLFLKIKHLCVILKNMWYESLNLQPSWNRLTVSDWYMVPKIQNEKPKHWN